MSLGAVGVPLDSPRLLRIHRTMMRWFILKNHQHPTEDGTQVVAGDVDPNLLKLATIRRCGSSRVTGEPLLVNLLSQAAATMPCALVVGARYVERVTTCARLGL
jgi:hypothetical protein